METRVALISESNILQFHNSNKDFFRSLGVSNSIFFLQTKEHRKMDSCVQPLGK